MYKIVREIKLTKILGDDKLSSDAKKIKDIFEDIFDGLEQYIPKDEPHITVFYKTIDGRKIIYFEQNSKDGVVWCSNGNIWSFFEEEFNYNYQEIKELTHTMLEMHLNRKVFPTRKAKIIYITRLEMHLNSKVHPT